MRRNALFRVVLAVSAMALLGCGTDPDAESTDLEGTGTELSVGTVIEASFIGVGEKDYWFRAETSAPYGVYFANTTFDNLADNGAVVDLPPFQNGQQIFAECDDGFYVASCIFGAIEAGNVLVPDQAYTFSLVLSVDDLLDLYVVLDDGTTGGEGTRGSPVAIPVSTAIVRGVSGLGRSFYVTPPLSGTHVFVIESTGVQLEVYGDSDFTDLLDTCDDFCSPSKSFASEPAYLRVVADDLLDDLQFFRLQVN